MQKLDVQKLTGWARQLVPVPVFPYENGRPVEYHASAQVNGALIDVHLLTLHRGLTYHRAVCSTAGEEGFLAIRVDGDPFKICINLSNRVLPNYTEGLPVMPHPPGEIHLLPLTRAAALVPPDTRGEFRTLFVSRDFMTEAADDAELPRGPRPASEPSSREPWVMSSDMTDDVMRALAAIEACPFTEGLRRLYVEARCLEIIALSLARLGGAAAAEPGNTRLRPRDLRKAHEARDLMLSRLDDPPSLREVARSVGMSTTSLKNAYRAAFGVPVFEHAREERLRRARLLLSQGELSVSEVADRVGFQSLGYFSAAFRKKFGLLPKEIWRCVRKDLP